MDHHGLLRRARDLRVPNVTGLLRLTSFISNTVIAIMFLVGAYIGVVLTIMQKTTHDSFGTGLMTRYKTDMPSDDSRVEFQHLWNYEALIQFVLLRVIFLPFLLALGSHELWLRRINDTALGEGKSLKSSYRPRFRRCHTIWASVSQVVFVVILALPALAATLLATQGAWMVEDNNPGAGISLPLSALNSTLYYGGVVPEDAVSTLGANLTSPTWFIEKLLELREKGFIHVVNPPISYHALYPRDTLRIPDEMRKTAYYLPRSSFPPLQEYFAKFSRQQMGIPESPPSQQHANFTSKGFRFGDAIYPYINTLGIGINMSSYERFMGDGMPGLPRDFVFGGMFGEVYGNMVNVKCVDQTDKYELSTHSPDVKEGMPTSRTNYIFTKWSTYPGNDEHHHFSAPSTATGPLIFADLSFTGEHPFSISVGVEKYDQYGNRRLEESKTSITGNAPLHTLFILPDPARPVSSSSSASTSTGEYQKLSPGTLVLKCVYMPSEYGIEYAVIPDSESVDRKRTKAGPLKLIDPEITKSSRAAAKEKGRGRGRGRPPISMFTSYLGITGQKKPPLPLPRCVNPMYALPAARAIHELLTDPTPENPSSAATTDHNVTTAGGILRELLAEHYQTRPYGKGHWARKDPRHIRETVIEEVFSNTASAYFSLLRQRVEIANLWVPLRAKRPSQKVAAVSLKYSHDHDLENATSRDLNSRGMGSLIQTQMFAGGVEITNSQDVLVKAVVFWVLRIGGAAPYGLSYLGCLVLFLIGLKALMAAFRTVAFGRGESVFGRWCERKVLATGLDKGGKELDREAEVEKGVLGVAGDGSEQEPLLGSLIDEKGATEKQ